MRVNQVATPLPILALLALHTLSSTHYPNMIIQLNSISLKRGKQILDDVDWNVNPGEKWAILGANGSGKTSIVNVILGYEPPTTGRFMVLGQPYGSGPWDRIRAQVGVASHAIAQRIKWDQSCLKAVISGKYGIINYWGNPTDDEKEEAERWLFLVGCEHLSSQNWGLLSQGEKQRVLIARSLIGRPQLLILDEPCAGLDAVARENFLRFLDYTLTEEFKIPSIMITHHLEEITSTFTHVLVMKSGRVVRAGLKDDVLNEETLSEAFSLPIRLSPFGDRLRMDLVR
jgi:iron complex transport system ATP-binding protein